MTLAVGNQANVTLTYTVEPGQSLALFYGQTALKPYGNALFVELQKPPTPPTCTLSFQDASGGDVHVWTIEPDGSLSAWTRARDSTSLTVASLDHDILVVHVTEGSAPPSSPSPSGPPAPGTSQTVLNVKVKDQGSLPTG